MSPDDDGKDWDSAAFVIGYERGFQMLGMVRTTLKIYAYALHSGYSIGFADRFNNIPSNAMLRYREWADKSHLD